MSALRGVKTDGVGYREPDQRRILSMIETFRVLLDYIVLFSEGSLRISAETPNKACQLRERAQVEAGLIV
jgi:hypothetical protein